MRPELFIMTCKNDVIVVVACKSVHKILSNLQAIFGARLSSYASPSLPHYLPHVVITIVFRPHLAEPLHRKWFEGSLAENTHHWTKDHCTAGLQLTRLD